MKIQPNSIIATPQGFVARVICIIGETATCRWIGSSIQFNLPISSLRHLGEEKGPLSDALPDLDALIAERNQSAYEWFIQKSIPKRGRGQLPKEKTLMEKLAEAQNNPSEFQRLLKENGLI